MSWTQVYISGLSQSLEPSNEDIELALDTRYNLSGNTVDDHSTNILWAGPGSTLIKRDDKGCCRGFAFLTFYSKEGAAIVVDRINNLILDTNDDGAGTTATNFPVQLRAELSNPKGAKERKKNKKKDDPSENLSDLRLRRQRKAPIRKHPVITSSNGKRTNLGNKTK